MSSEEDKLKPRDGLRTRPRTRAVDANILLRVVVLRGYNAGKRLEEFLGNRSAAENDQLTWFDVQYGIPERFADRIDTIVINWVKREVPTPEILAETDSVIAELESLALTMLHDRRGIDACLADLKLLRSESLTSPDMAQYAADLIDDMDFHKRNPPTNRLR